MGRDLTNLYVSESFQYILQKSGSEVTDGLGVDVDSLNISASYATNAGSANTAVSATSASLATENVVTASAVNTTITFTKGDGSTFDVTVAQSGSVASASYATYAETAGTANTASYIAGANVDGAVALATNATYADNTIITGKNLSGAEITKGTPLYFTGSGTGGNIVGVYPADASNANRMPAPGVAGETLAIGGEGTVLLDGYINGVDTSAFAPGDAVYVAAGGGYTNTRPTGSNILVQALGYVEKSAVNGSGVIQGSGRANDVPNIQENYLWKGDADGVAQAVAESSLSVGTAATASYVNPLTQSVQITGELRAGISALSPSQNHLLKHNDNNKLEVTSAGPQLVGDQPQVDADTSFNVNAPVTKFNGNAAVTGSLNGSGSFNINHPGAPTNTERHLFDLPSYTTTDGATYPTRFIGLQNYPAFGQAFEGGVTITHADPGQAYNYYSELNVSPNIVSMLCKPSSSATVSGLAAGPNADLSETYTYIYADDIRLGNNIPAAEIMIGADATDVQISGSVSVQNTITGTITNANTASYVAGANVDGEVTSAATASSVSSLNQNVDINGDLKVYGSTTLTGSLIVSASNNLWETDWPGSFQTRKVIDFGTITGADSVIYDDNFEAFYNYLGAGAHLNGVIRTFTGGGQYYFNSFWQGPNASYWLLTPSGSSEEHTISLRNDSGTTVDARVDATNVILGNTIASDIKIGNTGAQIGLSGSFEGTGSFNYSVANPANNTESHLFDLGATTTSDGASYPIRWVGQQNYGAFGQAFEDAWSVSHLDPGAAYGYYTEMLVGPNAAQMQLKPSGSGTLANFSLGASADLSSTFANIFANEVNVGHLLTQDIQIGNTSSTNVIKGTSTTISGSIVGEVSGLSIASQTASLDASNGNYFDLTLVSGSNTHVTVSNVSPGQTYILKTDQPTSSADSVGTITFNSEFKFAGGTAPTATATTGSVDVYTFVSFDSSNVLSTQVADLK